MYRHPCTIVNEPVLYIKSVYNFKSVSHDKMMSHPVFNTCVEHVLNSRLDSSQTQILGYVFIKDERKIEHVFKMC